eukprot:CAMPEP_0178955458 /NCGR_PEP_ID=MMETSP0789-20121207/9616_1 /TAXON_ID=3005 /ORGANISM="Rhizosolenia setigera, Strain CCMP 1694" /LENGTH=239 /DNA_ID=CAMNT_0020637091 /DNA_START=20 /DNA_END=736 /DNA_ORIENTATION=-
MKNSKVLAVLSLLTATFLDVRSAFGFTPIPTTSFLKYPRKNANVDVVIPKQPKHIDISSTLRGEVSCNLSYSGIVPIVADKLNISGSKLIAPLCILILSSYHIRLSLGERRDKTSWRKSQADTREAWAKYVRDTEGWLYAVQTLRNAITANTFLATTVLSLLTLISGKLWDMIRSIETGAAGKKTLILKFSLIALSMLASAYEFLQSARVMTHVGFMLPVTSKSTKCDNLMRKSQNCQW